MTGVGAQALGEPADRVVVGPGLAVDDLEALEVAEQGGPAGVVGCGPGHLLPHVEGLGGVGGLGTRRPPRALGHADEARRARVERHRYFPCQTGARFSAKALGPSLASSVWKILLLISCSSL